MNLKKYLAILLIIVSSLLVSCRKDKVKPEDVKDLGELDYIGENNYAAEDFWIKVITTEEGDMIEYRELLDIDAFLSNTDLPTILLVKKSRDFVLPRVIPQMEGWAYKYRDKANFVMIEDNTSNKFLTRLDYTVTPTYYLIDKYAVISYASYQEEDAFNSLEKKFLELIQE